MKYTIITPNYNGASYLEDCIKSVLKQNVVFEHIVVDANSEDRSIEILNKYPHLIVIRESDNGMYEAINKGIRASTGDVIAYLNVDDRLSTNALENVDKEFSIDESADYVYGDCRFIDVSGKELYIYKVPPIFFNVLARIKVVPWAQPSIFYKRNIFNSLGEFDTRYSLASDYHFMKRVIYAKFKGRRIGKVLSNFMKRGESLGSRYAKEMKLEVAQIRIELNLIDRPILDFFYNSYRKIYNFHIFFKKGNF